MKAQHVSNCRDCAVYRAVPVDGNGPRWDKDTISWWAPRPSQVSRRFRRFAKADQLADFAAAASCAIERWRPYINLSFRRSQSKGAADFVLTLGRIDGKSKTLAYAYMPSDQYIDPKQGDVIFDEVDFARLSHEGRIEVLTHEIGHSLGLEHDKSGVRSLMEPRYNGERFAGMLRPHDVERIQHRYGARDWKKTY